MAIISINTKQNPVFLDTSWFSTPSTMAVTYNTGAAAADQTLLIQAAKGGPVIFKANGAATGHLLEAQDSSNNVLFDITDNAAQVIRSGMADGATAVGLNVDTTAAWVNASARLLTISNNGVVKASVDTAGNIIVVNTGASGFLVPAGQGMGLFTSSLSSGIKLEGAGVPGVSIYNTNFGSFSDITFTCGDSTHRWNGVFTNSVNGGSSATNTTNMTITTNVADGASSVGLAINNTTNLVTGGADLITIANAGTIVIKIDTGGDIRFQSAASGVLNSAGNLGILFNDGGLAATVFGGDFAPHQDLLSANGGSVRRWTATWSKQYNGISQTLGFSATPAFDPTAGETIHIGTITGNVTGATMVSGNVGQQCTIVFLKDGTAGTYTLVFSGSNVRTAGTITMTATASSVSTISFRWDDRLPTPAWVETSRTNGI